MDSSIVFKENDNLGSLDAANDDLLKECFVETDALKAVLSDDQSGTILVGRTGSGKTAIARMIETKTNIRALKLNPESLGFREIVHSKIIEQCKRNGGSVNPLFKILWKHILIKEIMKLRYMESSIDVSKVLNAYRKQWDKDGWDSTPAVEV